VSEHEKPVKHGLDLDRVVLLGRTFDEYARFFGLNLPALPGQRILDVAAGVSSFTAEANARDIDVTALDRIYKFSADEIQARCEHDLEEIARTIGDKKVYRWEFYKSAEGMRALRAKAYRTFLEDFRAHPHRYVARDLPTTGFKEGEFDLTLASYLLFVYEDQLDYAFHKSTLLELARITKGEIRIYPTVTFEAEPSQCLARLRKDPECEFLKFEIIPTDFEFLRGSNNYLSVRRTN